ncbi:MAG: hypothetical protein HQM09_20230 [Candidatus Riflebacteria bacterium]|nr:hypothetical protein [Candidatus Riflebacteria bacterium]
MFYGISTLELVENFYALLFTSTVIAILKIGFRKSRAHRKLCGIALGHAFQLCETAFRLALIIAGLEETDGR